MRPRVAMATTQIAMTGTCLAIQAQVLVWTLAKHIRIY